MLYINISFDYELYMGKNYLPEEQVLIKPTDNLCRMLNEENISATFYIDYCCPICYRNLGRSEFANLFDNQVRNLAEKGQDIQLHTHPHWLMTTEVGEKVVFDRRYYRLHNWAQDDDYSKVNRIIDEGKRYLEKLIFPVNSDYQCVAFRSGGYSLQPENKIANILYGNGFKIDSSVCPGISHTRDGMYYDYINIPANCNFYFGKDAGLEKISQEQCKESIFEIPIGTYKTIPFKFIASKLNHKISYDTPTGYGMSLENVKMKKRLIDKIYGKLKSSNMITFDFYSANSIVYMIKRIIKEKKCGKNDIIISIIAHPKNMSDGHIDNMKNAIRLLKCINEVQFVNIPKILNIIEL